MTESNTAAILKLFPEVLTNREFPLDKFTRGLEQEVRKRQSLACMMNCCSLIQLMSNSRTLIQDKSLYYNCLARSIIGESLSANPLKTIFSPCNTPKASCALPSLWMGGL